MAYFSKFPVMQYPTGLNTGSLKFVYVRNLLRRISLTETAKNESSVFLSYDVKDGEKPEHIAERVYGSADMHWIILLCNEIIDPYNDWYKSQNALEQYTSKKYRGYRIFVTKTDDTLLYDSKIHSGATLSQGTVSSEIAEFTPQYCSLKVYGSGFSEGNATITTSDDQYQIKIHRVDVGSNSVHHFQQEKGATYDLGPSNIITVDPLSYQTNAFTELRGSVGLVETPYPTGSSGVDYSGTGVVSLWETYIGKYMGISGDQVNLYSVMNYKHEMDVNNSKRTIRVLHPRFKKQAVKELESLLGVRT